MDGFPFRLMRKIIPHPAQSCKKKGKVFRRQSIAERCYWENIMKTAAFGRMKFVTIYKRRKSREKQKISPENLDKNVEFFGRMS